MISLTDWSLESAASTLFNACANSIEAVWIPTACDATHRTEKGKDYIYIYNQIGSDLARNVMMKSNTNMFINTVSQYDTSFDLLVCSAHAPLATLC